MSRDEWCDTSTVLAKRFSIASDNLPLKNVIEYGVASNSWSRNKKPDGKIYKLFLVAWLEKQDTLIEKSAYSGNQFCSYVCNLNIELQAA